MAVTTAGSTREYEPVVSTTGTTGPRGVAEMLSGSWSRGATTAVHVIRPPSTDRSSETP